MPTVLHLYDSVMPLSAARQLGLLARGRACDRLVCLAGGHEREDLPAPHAWLRRPWGLSIRAARGLQDLAERFDADVIHCWSPALCALAAVAGRPMVASVFVEPADQALRMLRQSALPGSRVLAPSAFLADRLARRGVPASQISVISPLSVPMQPQSPTRAEARLQLGLPDQAWAILAVPQQRSGKDLELAVWAMAVVRQIDPDVRLILPGRGPWVRQAADFAAQSGFAAETIAPRLPLHDPICWAAADVAMIPSAEGFGLDGLAQALQARLPLLASQAAELAAELTDEQTALLAEPGLPRSLSRGLWLLRSRPDLARHIAQAAREAFRQRLDPAKALADLEAIYLELAGAEQNAAGPSRQSKV